MKIEFWYTQFSLEMFSLTLCFLCVLLARSVDASRSKAHREYTSAEESTTTAGIAKAGNSHRDTALAKKLATEVLLMFINSSIKPCDDFYDFACSSGYPATLAVPKEEFRRKKARYFTSFTKMVAHQLDRTGSKQLKRLTKKWKRENDNLTQSERQLATLLNSCKTAGTESSHEESIELIRKLFGDAGLDWFRGAKHAARSSIETLFYFSVHLGLTTPIVSLSVMRNRSKVEEKIIEIRSALDRRSPLQNLKRDVLMMRSSGVNRRRRIENPPPGKAEQKASAFRRCFERMKKSKKRNRFRDHENYENVEVFLRSANQLLSMGWNETRLSGVSREIESVHLCFGRMEGAPALNFSGTLKELENLNDFKWGSALQPHFRGLLEIHEGFGVHVEDYESVFALLDLGRDGSLSRSFKNYLAHWFLISTCGYFGEAFREQLCPNRKMGCEETVSFFLLLKFREILPDELFFSVFGFLAPSCRHEKANGCMEPAALCV